MTRSASHKNGQHEPEPEAVTEAEKRKPVARKSNGKSPAPRTASNGRKPAPVTHMHSQMLDADFDPATEQGLAEPTEVDIQGLDDMDLTERYDQGDTVKGSRSRNRGSDSIVEELDEIFDTLHMDDSEVSDAPTPASPKG